MDEDEVALGDEHLVGPIALVQHEAGPSVAPIRMHAQRAGLFFALTVALGAAAGLAQVQRARAAAAKEAAVGAPAPRISCIEARSVFEYRAKQAGPVARALFLMHGQDATIPEGEGALYLATSSGAAPTEETKARVLGAIEQIPCADKPSIRVMLPAYRAFDVEARLTIDTGETPALVGKWVRDALTDAFRPTDTSAHKSVQFGYYDRKLRWRVASAISQTQGVRSYELLLDGKRDDVPLAATEIAVLREVVLVNAATGKRL